ncbi:MAG: hypothetical protein IT422_13850 [Pirellulaceae bacterium]|nr:hypothetical protein [Pirellulaceae bacterium]
MNNLETVSKKRGRPTSLTESELQAAAAFNPGSTRRGSQNWAYQTRALRELLPKDSNAAPYSHFLPSENEVVHGRKKIPHVLLSEIGRLPFDWMKPIAQEICERRLSVKEAVKYVKQLRIGNSKKPFKQSELISMIANAIDSYSETHETQLSQILCALESVSEIVSELMEASE